MERRHQQQPPTNARFQAQIWTTRRQATSYIRHPLYTLGDSPSPSASPSASANGQQPRAKSQQPSALIAVFVGTNVDVDVGVLRGCWYWWCHQSVCVWVFVYLLRPLTSLSVESAYPGYTTATTARTAIEFRWLLVIIMAGFLVVSLLL